MRCILSLTPDAEKKLRKQLEERFGCDLTEKKPLVRAEVRDTGVAASARVVLHPDVIPMHMQLCVRSHCMVCYRMLHAAGGGMACRAE